MPIYEYHCNACGREFEVWQKITEGPVGKCEHCGSAEVAKLISSTSFHLKGGGWYVTDYAKKGSGESGSKAGAAKAEEAKSGEGKSSEAKSSESKADTAGSKESPSKAATPAAAASTKKSD